MNILVTGVGGPTPRSFVRAIRISGRESLKACRFIGVDCNHLTYGLYDRSLFNASYLVPKADHPDYWPRLNSIIEKEQIEIAVVLPEQEVLVWAENLHQLNGPVRTHLPDPKLVRALVDKYRLHKELCDDPRIPKFIKVNPRQYSYDEIVNQVGENFWIRGTVGSSGFGSLQIGNSAVLDNWIEINSTIEEFIATEFLPGRNLACKLLFFDGELKRTACAERVNYIMAKVSPSGITGNTSFGRLLNYPRLVEVSEAIMKRIVATTGVSANGIFTLDFKEDAAGEPKLTEINVRHVAFNSSIAAGGANLPADTIEALIQNNGKQLPRIDYQFSQPFVFLRDVDGEPILLPETDLFPDELLEAASAGIERQCPGQSAQQGVDHWLAMLKIQLNQVLATSKRPNLDRIEPGHRLQRELGLDSLELAELTVRLEAETGVDVFRSGLVATVGDILQRLEAKG